MSVQSFLTRLGNRSRSSTLTVDMAGTFLVLVVVRYAYTSCTPSSGRKSTRLAQISDSW